MTGRKRLPRDEDGTLAACPFCEMSLVGRSPPEHLVECGEFERQWRDTDRIAPDDDGRIQAKLPVGGGA